MTTETKEAQPFTSWGYGPYDDGEPDDDDNFFAWEDMLDIFDEELSDFSTGYWKAVGENMGWRHRSGYKYFEAQSAKEILRQVLPDTDCSFKIYKEDDCIKIVNSHHDAMGEVYKLYPIPSETWHEVSE